MVVECGVLLSIKMMCLKINLSWKQHGPKSDENWRKENITNRELLNLYRPPHIVITVKLRRLRWSGLVLEWEK